MYNFITVITFKTKGRYSMKNIKKISIILVTIAILFCVNSLQVFATTSIQDGIDVNLTTNKENYSKDEQITTTLIFYTNKRYLYGSIINRI